jgi:hypothetical protein
MGFNKIPLALKFDDATGNSTGLKEFTLNLSDVGDVCTTAPTQGQLLGYDGDKWCVTSITTGGGGTSVTGVPAGNVGQIVTYEGANEPTAASPAASPLNLATTGAVDTQIQDSLVGYATTALVSTTSGELATTALLSTTSGELATTALLSTTSGELATTALLSTTSGELATTALLSTTSGELATTALLSTTSGLLVPKSGAVNVVGPVTFTTNRPQFPVGFNATGTATVGSETIATQPYVATQLSPYATTALLSTTSGELATTALLRTTSGELATTALLSTTSGELLRKDVAGNSEIYYKNSATPDGLATTTGSRHFITDVVYDPTDLIAGVGLVYTGDGDGQGWGLDTGTGGLGLSVKTPAGTTGKAGSVTANSLILVSGTSVSATTSFQLDTRSQSFLSTPSGTTLGLPQVLHRQVGAPVASSNSTSLAELVSYTLPADHLALGDIDIMIRGRQLAQGSNLRWNFKIGGTNILNSSISQGTYSDFTRYTMHIQISKMETDRQMVTARFVQGTGTGSAAGFSGWSSTHRDGIVHNEATGDESGTLALSLEAQQSNSSQTVTVDHFTVTLIPNPI